jgi:hypothetical protein
VANATARVARAVRSYRDEILKHSYGTVTARTTLYVNTMLGLTVGGYLAKFDDTQTLRFFGTTNEDHGNPVIPSDGATSATAGAAVLGVDVRQPPAFELAITSVAITDIGRRVYALDDQTGTLDASATTYANLVGVVKDLIFATDGGSPVANYALVQPDYGPANGDQLQVWAANGAINLKPSTVILSKAGIGVMTLALPTTGVHDGMTIRILSSTANAHTVTTPAAGYNATSTIATFGGAKGDGFQLTAFGTTYLVNWTRNVTLS